jgi:three-Cys-motif partner protein
VGEWANEKIHYLVRYFDIFTTGMHKKWGGNLRYIEICSGPGRCSTRDGYEQDGTALAILNHKAVAYIQSAIFIDNNQESVDALNQRIKKMNVTDKAIAFLGDYKDSDSILFAMNKRPFDGLTLCFVDPTSCDIPFSTIEAISSCTRKVDFIVSFFSNLDFRRNAADAALNPEFEAARLKYETFSGCKGFFERSDVKTAAEHRKHDELLRLFMHAYRESLSRIGKIAQDTVSIREYYHLLFATGHSRGLDFWKKAKSTDITGQKCLPGLE